MYKRKSRSNERRMRERIDSNGLDSLRGDVEKTVVK